MLQRNEKCSTSDVNKDWTCKNQAYKDKNFTYSYLLQVAAKPTIAIEQQQWTQSESSQHMTVKPITLNTGLDRQGQGPSLQGPGQGLDLQGQGQGLKIGP